MPEQLTIGVDLGGTNIQCGLVDAGGKVVVRDSTKTKADLGPDGVTERIAGLVMKVLEKAGAKPGEVTAMGIGAAGAIDVRKGVVLEAPNLRWTDYPLRKQLEKRLDGVAVLVDNDVNVGAWGEFKVGAGKKFGDMLAIFVGTGIGGGLVLDGKLYRGALGIAGEIGHTTINPEAGVGRRTLEQRASRTAVVERIKQMIRANQESVIPQLVGGDLDQVRSKVLAQAVKEGGPLAIAVLEEAARDVGVAAANAVSLLSLPCVVLGGGLTEALRDWWVDRVRTAFEKHVFPPPLRAAKVVMSKLQDDAGVVGAALLAGEQMSNKT